MELADAIRTLRFVTQKEVTEAVAVRLDSLEDWKKGCASRHCTSDLRN